VSRSSGIATMSLQDHLGLPDDLGASFVRFNDVELARQPDQVARHPVR
jgi:hypothetical protein